MAEEVVRPSVTVTIDDAGSLHINCTGFNHIMLWGIAKEIEERANEVRLQAMMLAEGRKSKIQRI